MIDLHTHSLLSDGELLPCEMARRAEIKGYQVIGITDHADASNIEFVIDGLLKACKDINKNWKIKAIPGVELTHMPLDCIKGAVKLARSKGAKLVLVHGETIYEPVLSGTNKMAILSGADILAHPGIISLEDAKLAAAKGVYLEITARSGHSLANGHVAKTASAAGAKMVINSDSHSPQNLLAKEYAENILRGAGLDKKDIRGVFENSKRIVSRLLDNKSAV